MEEPKSKTSTDGKRMKAEAVFFLFSFVLAGLMGVWIPVWYVHTNLNSFFNAWLFEPFIFILVVILFGMSFAIAWSIIFYKPKNYLAGKREDRG